MAKKKLTETIVDEIVVVDATVVTEEVTTVALNEVVPEKEAPGHNTRAFRQ